MWCDPTSIERICLPLGRALFSASLAGSLLLGCAAHPTPPSSTPVYEDTTAGIEPLPVEKLSVDDPSPSAVDTKSAPPSAAESAPASPTTSQQKSSSEMGPEQAAANQAPPEQPEGATKTTEASAPAEKPRLQAEPQPETKQP